MTSAEKVALNDTSTLHFLSLAQSAMIQFNVKKINKILVELDHYIKNICEQSLLDGEWEVSDDFKFLVRKEKV